VNLCCLLRVSLWFGTTFAWIVIIKIFAISIPSQPFLSHHLRFHIFFHNGLLWGCTLFYSWAVFGLDFTSVCNCMLQSWHIAINGCCYLSYFLFVQEDICNTLHLYCVYFFTICIYFVRVNDYRLIESKHEAASSFQYRDNFCYCVNCLLSDFQDQADFSKNDYSLDDFSEVSSWWC